MLDMLRDCNTGIRWVLNHTQQHGGDPSRIFLVGQSCGAQIAALALITQVLLGGTSDILCPEVKIFIFISVRVHTIDGILASLCMPDQACSHINWAVNSDTYILTNCIAWKP